MPCKSEAPRWQRSRSKRGQPTGDWTSRTHRPCCPPDPFLPSRTWNIVKVHILMGTYLTDRHCCTSNPLVSSQSLYIVQLHMSLGTPKWARHRGSQLKSTQISALATCKECNHLTPFRARGNLGNVISRMRDQMLEL
jgi:hypothetical protein